MNPDDILVIAPNLKKRWSGVTSTVFRLVPVQAQMIPIACTGPNLPPDLPKITFRQILSLKARTRRVWHARRNTEMLAGLLVKTVLRKNLALMFTSAAQRKHSGYTQWLIRRMDRVVATSSKASAYLEVPNTVIMHGVDSERFHPAEDKTAVRADLGLPTDRRLIGVFGRIRAQKGTDIFVDIMIKLAARYPDITGVIMGGTTSDQQEFLKDLKLRVAAVGMEDRILFLGEQPDASVPAYFRAMDIFVGPQRWEGFGLTPLEAMASGVPVATTRAGAFEDMVVEGETGHVVDIEDAPALEAAIAQMLDDPEKTARMGRNARAHVLADFALTREAAALTKIYREALGQDSQA
ncbi:glycosyltransferase family 4 protein [Chachezhania sediminis]|uniref:glycosyltransferase family 4 protein n=1 Tax=Chachezhania sediminis TaxID=2599291 RepID=UPI00131E2F0B|nr:glycosyltransferase family 4 protein [Chachezhania sediminis]